MLLVRHEQETVPCALMCVCVYCCEGGGVELCLAVPCALMCVCTAVQVVVGVWRLQLALLSSTMCTLVCVYCCSGGGGGVEAAVSSA